MIAESARPRNFNWQILTAIRNANLNSNRMGLPKTKLLLHLKLAVAVSKRQVYRRGQRVARLLDGFLACGDDASKIGLSDVNRLVGL